MSLLLTSPSHALHLHQHQPALTSAEGKARAGANMVGLPAPGAPFGVQVSLSALGQRSWCASRADAERVRGHVVRCAARRQRRRGRLRLHRARRTQDCIRAALAPNLLRRIALPTDQKWGAPVCTPMCCTIAPSAAARVPASGTLHAVFRHDDGCLCMQCVTHKPHWIALQGCHHHHKGRCSNTLVQQKMVPQQ